ncbi:MAG: glycogen synthase [Anaerolineaceae bacterium]|nr:glycogen synthase [Anaerolineaceae bacterium]
MVPPQTEISDLHVLFIAAEADPLVKAGGLGDVAGSLPVAIHNLNLQADQQIDIRLAIPFYNPIKTKPFTFTKVAEFDLESTEGLKEVLVFSTKVSDITVYLIAGEPISRSDETYGSDFQSDAEKFVFFSLACLKLPSVLKWRCDILHTNDWHTATAVHHLKSVKANDPYLAETKTVLTVHNLPFMGTGAEAALAKYRVKPSSNKNLPAWAREIPLPMGLAAADQIVAVSPTYAKEIMTPEFGCDLEGFLQTRRAKLTGILNGIDVHSWDPAVDPALTANFTSDELNKRRANKTTLLREFNFEGGEEIPLLVLISRMDKQKGVDILLDGLRSIKDLSWRAILLGTGDKRLEQACQELENDLPHKVRATILFDSNLSRRLYAGGDMVMMPSRYEPCGLTQMFAMRYGCLPVARATGGLVDTIIDPKTNPEGATGFLFPRVDPDSFVSALKRAFQVYSQPEDWQRMQFNAMQQDFSWQRSAQEYVHIYREIKKLSS